MTYLSIAFLALAIFGLSVNATLVLGMIAGLLHGADVTGYVLMPYAWLLVLSTACVCCALRVR